MSGGGYNRRQVAARLGAAALLPHAALSDPLNAAPASRDRTAPPGGAFQLQRVLTRELSDGAAIVVTRRWRIAFAPAPRGITVTGAQTFADVLAPPALSPLANLERTRSTAEMFPIALDRMGLIAGSERGMDAAHLLRAIEVGRGLLEREARVAAMMPDARRFLAQLAGMGAEAVSAMPRDLFFPIPERSTATREITLPGGATGTISIATDASVDPETGLMATSERRVVTRIGKDARTSREAWALTRLA